MLATVYVELYDLLASLFGGAPLPDILDFWLNGATLLATFFVCSLPFIIVFKVVGWLRG